MTRTPLLAVLLVALTGGTAHAQSDELVIVFPAEGTLTGPLAKAPEKVTAGIAQAARARGSLVEVSTTAKSKALGSCGQAPDCLGKFAAARDADVVVAIEVAPADKGLFVDVDVATRGAAEPVRSNWLIDAVDLAAVEREIARLAPSLFAAEALPEPAPEPAPAPVLPPEDFEAPTGRPDEDRPSRLGRVRAYSWITAGAGVALLAGGTVFLMRAGAKQDEIDGSDPRSLSDFQALETLEDEASSRALWGNIMAGAGLVALGVGTALIVVQMRSDRGEERVSLSPTAFDRGVGFALTVVGDL